MSLMPIDSGRNERGDNARALTPAARRDKNGAVIDLSPSIPPDRRVEVLQSQVKQMQDLTRTPIGKTARRLLFCWLRIYVNEVKRGKATRVDLKIPIPIPVLGLLLRSRLTTQQALAAIELTQEDMESLKAFVESCMGAEFIRVEEERPERDSRTQVVIGLD